MHEERKHIAFIASEYVHNKSLSGGIATYVRKLAMSLIKRGNKVSVFFLSNNNIEWIDEEIHVYAVKESTGNRKLKIHLLRWFYEYWQVVLLLFDRKRLAKRVWKINTKNKIDIIHTFNYKFPGLALCNNGKIPLVCRMSSYGPNLRAANGGNRYIKNWIMDYLETQQVLKSDYAFAPSEFIADLFNMIEGMKLDIIRTPLDNTLIIPDPAFYNKHLVGEKYLLYFGTLNRLKGVDLISDIIPDILEKNPDLYFVFLGKDQSFKGSQTTFKYILSQNKDYVENIFYFNPIPKTLLYDVIRNAHGVLMPSRTDNYPNACLEAKQFGIPVVGTYQSSLNEMIEEGETGFLAKNGDAESLKSAVFRLLAMDDNEREIMKKKILNNVEEIRSEDRVGQLIEVYERLAKKWKIKEAH